MKEDNSGRRRISLGFFIFVMVLFGVAASASRAQTEAIYVDTSTSIKVIENEADCHSAPDGFDAYISGPIASNLESWAFNFADPGNFCHNFDSAQIYVTHWATGHQNDVCILEYFDGTNWVTFETFTTTNRPPTTRTTVGPFSADSITSWSQVDDFQLTFRGTDKVGGADVITYYVDAIELRVFYTPDTTNQAPTLDSIGPKVVDEAQTLQFRISSTDPDLDTIVLAAQDLPANATFVDSGNGAGLLTFNSGYDQAGVHYVTFIASDRCLADSEVVEITVNNVNRAPVADAGPDQLSAYVNTLVTLDGSASTDPDGDSIGYHWRQLSGLAVTLSDTNAVNPTFTTGTKGDYEFELLVDDAALLSSPDTVLVSVVNRAPALDSIGPKVVEEAQTLQFRISSADPDGDFIILSAESLPANAAFSDSGNGAGSFIFTPDNAQSGVYNVTFIASDGSLADSEAVEITVNDVNEAPAVSDIPDQTILEGETFAAINLDDYVSDVDNGDSEMVWTYSGNTELTVDITNRVVTISTPGAEWSGSETITFRATDPGSLYDEDGATLTVTAVNDTPVVSDIPDQTIPEGWAFSAINLDDYVSDVDNADSELIWTYSGHADLSVDVTNRIATITIPHTNWSGSETITFRATDPGSLYDENGATFTVTAVNDTPIVFDIPDQTVAEGSIFATISLDDYVSDVDHADSEMVWTYSGNIELAVYIDNRVATINTPDEDWNGSETIMFRAADPGGLYDEDATALTATALNDAPVVSDIPDQTIAEGLTFATINLDDYVSDVDNADSEMVWTYSGNTELTVDITDRVATISTPDVDWTGSEAITFRATDPGSLYGEDGATFTVTAVNDTPVVSDIPDQSIPEGSTFATINLDDYVSDLDHADSDMVWTYSGDVDLTVDITDRVATISIPGTDWNGSETITFRATDPGSLYDEDGAAFTVTAVNDAPVVSDIPGETISEGSTFATINLDDYVSDVDHADSDMVWTYSGNSALTVDITDRVATISTPDVDWTGSEPITFRATDPGSLYDEDGATFTVTAVNDTPVVSDIPDETIPEGSTFATISLDDYVSDVDHADSDMVWTYSGNTQLTVDITDRVATISPPDLDWTGSETITFRATDPGSLYDEDGATFTVSAVNDTPVVSDIPDQIIAEGLSFATINLDDYVSDLDHADSEMVWTYSGDVDLTVDITDRVATISAPDLDWNGSETITFRATDPGSLYDEDGATFTVTAVNDAPVLDSIGARSVVEGGTLEFRIHASDVDLDSIVLDTLDVPLNAVFVDSGNGAGSFVFTPDLTQSGVYNVTFMASDLALVDTEVVEITVTEAGNQAPVVSDIPDQTIAEGSSFATVSLDDYVSDADHADSEMVWTYSGNTELTVDITDRVATISIPGTDWNGSETITFRATDPGSLYDENGATFTVTAVNDTPVVSDIPDQTISEGETFATVNLDDYVSDVDHADSDMVWTYSGNTELTVDITDRVATISTPDVDWTGSEAITFRATDPGSLYDEDGTTFTVTAVNDTPVVSDIPDESVPEGSTFTTINLDDYVSDVDHADSDMVWTYSGNTELSVDVTDRVATISIPGADWTGSETVTFRAADPGSLYDEDGATFTVTAVNDTPVVSDIPDQTISEGETFATVNLDDYVSDVDHADSDMVWTYSGNSALTVDITDRVATISTPDVDWTGSEPITFRATDPGGLYDEDGATFTVTAVNDTPVVSDIPDETIPEGETFATINLDDYVSDVDDADSDMVWTYSGNSALTVDITDRVATIGPPDLDWTGSEPITFRATDPGGLYDEDGATFTVSAVNDTPVVSDIPDQTISEGETFATINLDDYVSDVDHADSDMVWTYSGNTQLTVDITNRVATISTPDVNWNDSETITFRATDPGGLYDEDGATFTVTAVNDTPVVSDIPDQTIPEGSSFATVNLDDYVSDVDHADSEMVWTYSGNTQLAVDITDRVATIGIPDADWTGSETVTFRAADPGSLYDEDGATFTVTGVNDTPVVSDIPDQTISEGETFATVNLDDYVSDVDHADSDMVWTYSGNTELTVDITDRVATISTPDVDWTGSEAITFRATDPGSLYDEDGTTFTVTAVNDTPVVSDIPDESVPEGSTFTTINLDDYVSDVDHADSDMVWTYSGNTELSVDVTDRVATISPPDPDWNGSEPITFRATDPGGLYDEDGATFTVTAVNDTPVVSDIPGQTISEGSSFATINLDDYVSDVDHADSDMVWTYSGNSALTVDITDRVATIGPPDLDWTGSEPITFRATDPGGLYDEDGATFTVSAVNDTPVVSDIPDQTISEGETFATINLDDYVSDVDHADSELVWTYSGDVDLTVDITDRIATISIPGADWTGSETVTFRAADPGSLYDEDGATFTVTAVNDTPVVSDIPDQTISEGETFATVNLDDYVSDVDHADSDMVWTYSGNSALTVDITDRVATISTPDVDWTGSEPITFRATDPGGLYDEDGATFTVTAVNDTPVVSDIPDETIPEGETFATINLDDYVSDVDDADSDMVWTYSGNSALTVDITDRVATIGPPDLDWTGSEPITFRATDPGGLYDEDGATFTVTAVNDTPVVSDIPGQTISEGSSFATINLDDYVSDVDHADSDMVWTYSGNSALTVDITDRVATIGPPDLDWTGSEPITFRATDPGGLYDEDGATFTVSAVNDTPVVSDIPDQTISEGETFATINLDDYVSDVDHADSELVWTYSGDVDLTVDITDRVATISIPGADWTGSETVTFRAADPGSLYDEDGATFTVTAVNDTPVVSDIPDQTISEGETFATVNLDDYVSDVDHADSELVWTYSGDVDLTVDITDRVATISIPGADWSGSEAITFRAMDPDSLYDEDGATFTVIAVNDTPIVSDIPDQTIAEGSMFATINLDDYVSDVDDADSDMVWTYSGNTELTVDITDRVATISTPGVDWNGSEPITFRATDPGGLYDEDAATFTVTAVNDTPVVSDIPDQTISEGSTFATINLDDYVSDVDHADSDMVWTYSGNTELTVDITDRVATISPPDLDWTGSEPITFRATDPGGLYDEDAATFTVTAVNDTPVVSDIPGETISEGSTFATISLDDYVSDVDDADSDMVWTYSGNTELSVDITDRVATISTPGSDWNGSEPITFRATDPGGLYDEDAATFTVTAVNDTPVVSDIPDQTISEGSTFVTISLDDYVSDVDHADSDMVWTYSGNTELTVDITDRVATISPPDLDWTGSEPITFRATDPSSLYDEDAGAFTVTGINDVPVLDSIGARSVSEGSTLEFRIHATDIDLDSIILDTLNVPLNAVFIDSGNGAGSFVFTPDYDQSGLYGVTFIASDGSLADSEVVSITVDHVNREPVLSSIGPRSVLEGAHIGFFVTASDPDGDSLILSAENRPVNSSFTDSGNGKGIFEFDPDYTQSGIYYVTFKASDSDLADSEVVQITVIEAGNQAPALDSIGPKSVAEAETLQFRFHANDPDGSIPALFVRNNPANSTYSDSGNGAGTFTFAPNYDQVGIYLVTFAATDGALIDSEVVEITVTNVNRPPVLDSMSPKTLAEGDTLEFRIHASDPDMDLIVLDTANVPLNAVFVDSGNGAGSFVFTPDFTQSGIYNVTFLANDTLGGVDSEVVQITVTEFGNNAPVLDSIGPQAVDEGDTLEFRIHATDLDADSIILDTLNVPVNAVFVDSGNGAGSFVFTPDYTQSGAFNVTFIASDGSLADSEVVQITVNHVNLAPGLDSIGAQMVVEGDTLEFRIHASDPDLDLIVLDTLDVPVNAVFIDSGNGAGYFVFTPDFTQAGVYDVTFMASDGALVDTEVVEITVTEVGNQAPVVSDIPDQSISEGETFATINLDDYVIDVDDADSEMVWTYSGNTQLTVDITDRIATITTPGVDWNGSETITFRATDPGSLYDEDGATFTVSAVNDTPVVSDIPDQTVPEGSTFATINLDDYVSDVDDADSEMVWTYSGNSALTVDITDRVATITTPGIDWNGSETVTFRATDPGSLYDDDGATFTVSAVNDTPVVTDIPDQIIAEGSSFAAINLDDYVSDVDDADSEMVWTYSGNSALTVDITDRVATISTPGTDWNGSETIAFRATDPGSLYDEDAATFTVSAVSDMPIVSDIPDQSISEGETFATINLDDYVSDVDDADSEMVWTYSGNTELTVDITDRIATISTPGADWNGSEAVTFRATDPDSLYDEDAATFTVTAVNDTPVVSDIPGQTIPEGSSFTTISLDDYVSDVDNADSEMVWTYSGNTELTVDITDRVATITTPGTDWNGSETVTFRATDPSGLYDEDGATFTVTAVSDTPIVSDIPDQSISEGSTFATINLDDYVTDVDDADSEMVWTYSGNSALTVDITDRIATITIPGIDWNGSESITFRATDPDSLYDEDAATFTVNAVNDTPVVSDIPDQTIPEGSTFATINLDDYVSDVDNADSEMVWTYSGNSALTVDITDRVATITIPGIDWNGSESVTFRATDPGGLYDDDGATFTVSAVNDTPVVTDIPDQIIAEGSSFASINLDDYVSDVDDADSDMIWTYGGNTELSVDITDRVATITTPGSDWNGSETVTFRATDPGSLYDEDAATFTVSAVSDTPFVSDIPDQSMLEGETFATINLDDYVSDVDDADSEMVWTYTGNTELTVDITDRIVTISTPGSDWNGSESITFRATDPDSLYDEDAAIFTMTAVNDTPVVSDIPGQTIPEGSSFTTISLDDYVSDVDDADSEMVWTYSGNTELTVDITDRVAAITTPGTDWNGTETITFRATDPGGLYDEDAGIFTVSAVSDTPLVSDIPDQNISEGSTFATINLDDYVTDVDDADSEMVWTYSGNSALTVDITDRIATITIPGIDWNGSESITFRATDPDSLYDEDAATFTVNAVNDTPVVSDIPDQTVPEGSTFAVISLDDHVSDVDNADSEMVWTYSGNSALTVDITDRVATITIPGIDWNGSESVTFRATDPGSLYDQDAAAFTVTGINDTPVLDSIGDRVLVEGDTLEFRIHATDVDGDPLILDTLDVPVNAVFVDSGNGAGSFVFTPDFTQSGIYNITFIASDGSLADSELVGITVTEFGNNAPELDSIGLQAVDEGDTLEFRIHTIDVDADSIILDALNVPVNATFVDSGNGAGSFVFMPDFTQSGVYTVTFISSDGSLADSEMVELTVNQINIAPVLDSIGPRSVIEGGHLAFLVTASDFDGDSLTLGADFLPNNASFTDSGNGKGTFEFDPAYTQEGLHYVIFKATDAALTDSEIVEITVIDAGNQIPVLDSIGPKTVAEADTLLFTFHATDPDGGTPALFVRNNPANSTYSDSGNGTATFTFAPNYDQAATYLVTFAATDGSLLDSEVVEITVTNVNRLPELDSIGAKSFAEGNTLEFRIHASDPDLDLIVLDTANVPLNAVFVDSGNGAGSFVFTPDFTQSGIYNVTFFANDTLGGSDSEVVQITVSEFGNIAPELDSIGPQAVAEGDTLELRIHATDLDADPIILDTLNVPLNAAFVDSGNGAGSFVFAPDFTQSGIYYVTFTASDGFAADSEVVEITVNHVNLAPELDSIGPQVIVEGDTLELRIHASDPDLDSIILDTLNVPVNAVFVDSGNGAGSLVFTPDFEQAGVYNVTFRASDGSLADSELVQITVTEYGNHAPDLDSIGPQAVVEGDALELRIHASDIDGDPLILDTLNVPANAVFVDSGNGAGSFVFTPDFTQSGVFYVTFIASDGLAADSELVEITVTEFGNHVPELDSIGSQTVIEGGTLEFRIHATDIDQDSLILDTLNAPVNAVFVDSGNGAGSFVFTPDFTQSGVLYVTFIASDGFAPDSEVVGITVTEFGNHTPVLDSIGPQTVVEGNTLELRIHASDIDADSLILDTLNVPTNAVFVDSGIGAGSFVFTPDFTQSGVFYVTFIASDGSAADSEVVEITVTESGNHAPELDSIGPQTVVEGNTLEFRMHASDIDADSLILDTLNVPTNATFVDSGNGAGSFVFTPDFTQSGVFYVTFMASDGFAADSEVVEITVTEFGNHTPVLDSIGPQAVVEGDMLEFRIHASDIDGDPIILDTLNVPVNAVFVDSGNGAGSFVFTPDFTQSGVFYVTFVASDGFAADSEVVEITVTEYGNHVPVLDSIGPQAVVEGDMLEFRIHASDIDGDPIILDTLNVPVNAVFVDSGNGAGSFVFTPDFTQSGVFYVTFVASDGFAADSEVVEITVTEYGNHVPVLDSIGPQAVVEGDMLEFRIHASDIDGDPIILDTLNVPVNAVFVDSGNGAGSFLFIPDFDQSGVFYVTFIASDGSAADSEVVEITVTEFGNHTPELDSIGPQTVVEGNTLEFRIHASDTDSDPLILDTLNVPANAVFVDSGNGAGSFVFTPNFAQSGTFYVTFMASDGSAADSEVVEITVTEFGNHVPELDSIGPQTVVEGDTLEFRVHATDLDLDSIILQTIDRPIHATFVDSGNESGSFFFAPDFSQSGDYYVTFVASDGPSADSQLVQITVTEYGNHAPELDSIGTQTLVEGDTLELRIHATDLDGNPIVLDTVNVPPNAVFVDSGNGAGSFIFTPDFTQAGRYDVTFFAFDGFLADSEDVQIVVIESGNHAPELDSIGSQLMTEGDTLEFRIHAIDPDTDPIMLDTLNVPLNAVFVDSGNGAGSFTFMPDYSQSGIHNVTFIASDPLGAADSQTVVITVMEFGNHAPELDSIGPQTVSELDILEFRIHAVDIDADSLILDTLNIPLNAVFVDSGNGAGSFTFAPDTGQTGIYYVTFMAADTALADSEVVEITVTEWSNRPPVLDSIGPKTVSEGGTLSFGVAAHDPDGTIPLLATNNLPGNATFVDSGNGHGYFEFHPDFYQAGVDTVAFQAIDTSMTPELSDIENVVITVLEVNQPPVIDSIGPKTVRAGSTLTIRVVGRDLTDPDGGPLHLSILGLPPNATFVDSGGGIGGFVFAPDYSQVGVDTVTFRCLDEGSPPMTGSQKVEITVTEGPNRPPVLAYIGYKMVTEGDTLEFRVHAADPDGTTPQLYTSMPLPTNASFTDSGNGAGSFLFTPDFTQSALHEITFYASDGDLIDNERVFVQVVEAGNQYPVLDSIGSQSVLEGDTLIIIVRGIDPDSTIPELSVDSLPFGVSFADSGDGTGVFEFHPVYVQAGVYSITFMASDGELADSEAVQITVIEAGNQAPAFVDSIGPRSVKEREWLTFGVGAADPDSTTPILRASDLPPSADFTDNGDGTGTFVYRPTYEEQGVYYTLFEAVDSVDTLLKGWELVEITVIDSNRHPTVFVQPDVPIITVDEGDTTTLTVIGTDPDGTIPSLHVVPMPDNATFTDSGNGVGVFVFTPDHSQGGVYPQTFRVYVESVFVIDETYPDTIWAEPQPIWVYDVPEPPGFVPMNDTSVVEGDTLDIYVVTTSIADIPALAVIGSPANSSFEDSGNGRGWFHFEPDFTQGGSGYLVGFVATSRGLVDTEYVQITVLEWGNNAPVLDFIGAQTVGEEQVLSFRIHATDIDGDAITLDTLNVPQNAVFVDSGNGAGSFVFNPDWTQAGVYYVTFYAEDTPGAIDSEVVEITVTNVDQPPVLNSIGAKTVAEGETLQFRVHATDLDSDSLVLTAGPLPGHATFVDSGNGAGSFTFTPDYYQAEVYSVYFSVSDLVSSDMEMVPITVTNVPQPPDLDLIPLQSLLEGDTLEFRIHATDPDGDPFVLSVENNPANSSLIDSGNGAGSFLFTPSYLQSGTYQFPIYATDTTGRADSAIVQVEVIEAGNQPPVLASLPDSVEPAVGRTFIRHVYATDPDGPSISLSTMGAPWNSDFADSGNGGGVFTFAPDSTQEDSIYLVTFIASDGSLADSQTVVMQVISYVPGDVNGDGSVNVGDVVALVDYLYRGGPPPDPMAAGDTNCDGHVNVGDVVYLVDYLYRGGPPPTVCP